MHDIVNLMHTVPHKSQAQDMSAPFMPRTDPKPRFEGEEYEVERILNNRKRERRFQFLTLMKGFPTHDAE